MKQLLEKDGRPDAANTRTAKAEQNETPDSASSVNENKEGCQA